MNMTKMQPWRRGAWVGALTLGMLPVVAAPSGADLTQGDKLRAWSYYQARLTDPKEAGSSLAVARSKVMVAGKPRPDLDYYFQMIYKNGNKSGTDGDPYVQELWARFKTGNGRLTVGQFKPPIGLERFTWDGSLDLILRTQATDRLIPNGKLKKAYVRDYGLQWNAAALDRRLHYYLSAQGGNGANSNPHGIAPLLGARAVWTVREGKRADKLPSRLTVGGAFSTRSARNLDFASALSGTRPLGYGAFSGRDTRWNLELAADEGPWRWRGEYFSGRFASDKAAVPSLNADGWYVQGCYQWNPKWATCLRYEAFDPNTGVVDKNDLHSTTLGMTYFRRGNDDKLMLNYVWQREGAGAARNEALIAQYQHRL